MTNTVAALKILNAGVYSTIQDRGRFGLRHLGIPWSGVICPAWQEIANALVSNPPEAAVIECFEGGLQCQAESEPLLVSVVCSDDALIKSGPEDKLSTSKPNRSYILAPGECLAIVSTGSARLAVFAVAGISVNEHLGSASTYAKASLGGLGGPLLQAGDEIHVNHAKRATGEAPTPVACILPDELQYQCSTIRVVAGPQFDHFSGNGQHTFSNSDYFLSTEVDRMGARFDGPPIEHRDASAKDIVSDAIVPGSIQIPGSGLPIVLLNDAQTAGGYPKIATVATADLPLPGLQRAGSCFRFKLVSIDDAINAIGHVQQLIEHTISAFTPCVQTDLDSETLLKTNLIDGVTDGLDESASD